MFILRRGPLAGACRGLSTAEECSASQAEVQCAWIAGSCQPRSDRGPDRKGCPRKSGGAPFPPSLSIPRFQSSLPAETFPHDWLFDTVRHFAEQARHTGQVRKVFDAREGVLAARRWKISNCFAHVGFSLARVLAQPAHDFHSCSNLYRSV